MITVLPDSSDPELFQEHCGIDKNIPALCSYIHAVFYSAIFVPRCDRKMKSRHFHIVRRIETIFSLTN
ncbi:MAG: hypothetical protein D6690_10905 [Nitrospirae bacterium]|nr:MAG: hypothetical protein D6690_10905 [Nitrospirota bacterium]